MGGGPSSFFFCVVVVSVCVNADIDRHRRLERPVTTV